MMIGDDQQQQGDQFEPAMGLGEEFPHQPLVTVDASEDHLAGHISPNKKTLFCVSVGVQYRTVWAGIDTGVSRNLISQQDYEALPHPPTLRPPGSLMVVSGNNHDITLLEWITLRFTINTHTAYHAFGVGKNSPSERVFGCEFLRPLDCKIIYQASGRDVFSMKDGTCEK